MEFSTESQYSVYRVSDRLETRNSISHTSGDSSIRSNIIPVGINGILSPARSGSSRVCTRGSGVLTRSEW